MFSKKYYGEMMADATLRSFLEERRVKRGEPFTHTTKVPSGSYYIEEDSTEKFFTIFCNAIKKGVGSTLTEKPGAYGPLRVDFDLKSTLEDGLDRQYNDTILESIIKYYQEEIKNCIPDEEFEEKMLYCILLEKPSPRVEEGKVKDGFHLHFPHFICEPWIQDELFRGRVTEKMIENKIWESCKYIDPVGKFIDEKMGRKQWLMYGASKAEKAVPFLFSKAFGPDASLITLDKVFSEEMIGRKSSVEYYLPRFLSIRGYSEATILTQETEAKKVAFRKRPKNNIQGAKKKTIEQVMEDIKTIKEGHIMEMLSEERADDHNCWMDVGWTLFNIGQGCEEAMQLWIDFSKKSPKFIEGECEERWGRMELRDKGMGSLLAMAKADSPQLYKEWRDTNIKGIMYRSLHEKKPNEWDIAQVIKCLYRDKFLCAESKNNLWYEFKNHRWHFIEDVIPLKDLLATEVTTLYYTLKAEISNQQIRVDENERSKLAKQELKCNEIITALKTVSFQDKLIRMCKVAFYDGTFLKKRDSNRLLFGCENGVIDLEMGIFRDGRPDDYITYSCGLEYHDYNFNDDEVKELDEFLEKVFPDVALREYFLDATCAAMEGGNVNKTFIVGTGNGNNGKTITYSLLEKMFGEYCIKFPRELLVVGRGNSSGSARPELSRVRGRRLALVQEISKEETINIGVLKELTGNDSFFSRGLYKEGEEIEPTHTLMMQCNEPPNVPGHDDATWNRIRILDFKSRFVVPRDIHRYPVPSTKEEQMKTKVFYADVNFAKKLNYLAPVLLWKSKIRYTEYKKRGLKEPQEVLISTSVYRAMNDVYLQFMQEKVEKIEYPKGTPKTEMKSIKLSELYPEFTSWYQETYSYSKEKFNKISVMHEFNKKMGSCEKKGASYVWYGYKIADDEQEQTQFSVKLKTKNKPAKESDPIKKQLKEEVTKVGKKLVKTAGKD